MLHPDPHEADVRERLSQPLSNHDRAVPPSGAADGNGQIGLPFLDVVRNQIPQVFLEAIHEAACGRVAFHEFHHGAVATRPPAQPRHEMRVRQAADVEHQIGVERNTMLETEAEKRDDEPGARTVAGETHEELAQLVDRHVGGIDDFVRQRSPGTKRGFGRQRTSNIKSASSGTPCLKPKLRSVMTSRARERSRERPMKNWRSSWTVMSEVSTISSASAAPARNEGSAGSGRRTSNRRRAEHHA